jgi:hypothetical protein
MWCTCRKYIPAFEGKHKGGECLRHFYTTIIIQLTHLYGASVWTRAYNTTGTQRSTVCLREKQRHVVSYGGVQGKLTRAHSPPFHAATISVIAGGVASSLRPIPWVDSFLSRSMHATRGQDRNRNVFHTQSTR